jgi:hypothetical protein
MFNTPDEQTVLLFPLFLGSLAILLAVFDRRLLHLIGLKPPSEVYTTPRFQRSAKITEGLGRLFLLVFGLGFLFQGAGGLFGQFLSSETAYSVSIAILGLAGLILLVMFGVVLANWKARET